MGFRKQEVLQLQWHQLDLHAGTIRLAPQDTKAGEHRVVYMTARVRAVLGAIPKTECPYVFVSARTGTRFVEIRFMFHRALKAAGLPDDLWVHDLRRSFVTNARRRGIAESVVMRMSGHRTRSVFDRYNVVDEADLKHAAAVLEAGAARESGQEMVKVGALPQTR